MAMSGVQISSTVVDAWTDLKIRKKYRYLLIKFDASGTKLEVTSGPRDSTIDQFLANLKDNECAYAAFDSPTKNKLVGLHWNPDSAPVKSKMSSASTAKTVQDKLDGLGALIQVTDRTEVKEACC